MLFDYGKWNDRTSSDALVVPLHKGRHRMKRVSRRFKERIARMASQGEGFKSGAHILHVMNKLNIKHGISSLRVANNWVNPVMAKYLAAIRLFAARFEVGVVSISWDATRLSGKDRMFSKMHMHGKAFWCPPMAPCCIVISYALFDLYCTTCFTDTHLCFFIQFTVHFCIMFCRR